MVCRKNEARNKSIVCVYKGVQGIIERRARRTVDYAGPVCPAAAVLRMLLLLLLPKIGFPSEKNQIILTYQKVKYVLQLTVSARDKCSFVLVQFALSTISRHPDVIAYRPKHTKTNNQAQHEQQHTAGLPYQSHYRIIVSHPQSLRYASKVPLMLMYTHDDTAVDDVLYEYMWPST